MNYKRILLTAAVLLLSTTVFICPIKADATADSLRLQMKHLTGEHLLLAHSNWFRLAAGEDNLDNELATLNAYIDEANTKLRPNVQTDNTSQR